MSDISVLYHMDLFRSTHGILKGPSLASEYWAKNHPLCKVFILSYPTWSKFLVNCAQLLCPLTYFYLDVLAKLNHRISITICLLQLLNYFNSKSRQKIWPCGTRVGPPLQEINPWRTIFSDHKTLSQRLIFWAPIFFCLASLIVSNLSV